jgi:hypothetical protein
MQPETASQARQLMPGRLLFVVVLLAALLLALLGPLSFLPQAHAAAQTITPAFVYRAIVNGAYFDSGHAEVVDSAGNAYVLARAYDSNNDVMIVKLSPSGAVLFTTYLRGSQTDWGTGLALDGQGGLLVSGWTDSADFPVVNAAQPVKDARRSGFLTRLSTADGSILYSSFFGAGGADEIHGLAINAAGEVTLVGKTDSTDFPTLNPLQAGLKLVSCFCDDAFIVRLSPDLQTLEYGTYFGGGLDDQADSVALDAAGNIYVAGVTKSDDFPTANPIQAGRSGDFDVWIARISAAGDHVDYSTYLGGSSGESLANIAVDPAGYATLAGTTNSSNFPTTSGSYQPVFGGGLCGSAGFDQRSCYDGFVTRRVPDGSSFAFSTYRGGGNDDEIHAVTIDGTGNVYMVGYAYTTDVPPNVSIFVEGLDATGSQLRYSLHEFSAVANDGHGIALGPDGDVYFTGAQNAPSDLYAARLTASGTPLPTATPLPTSTPIPPTPTPTPSSSGMLHVGDLDGSATSSGLVWRANITVLVHDADHNPIANVAVSGKWSNGYSGNAQCVTAGDGTCALSTGNIRRNTKKVTFTVTNLIKAGFTYSSAANHDPDGDSNGTSIVVARP